MILKDNDGNSYEFEQEEGIAIWDKPVSGTLKPVDSWPKEEDEFWYIDGDGDPYCSKWYSNDRRERFFEGIYKTKEQALAATERVRSLQEANIKSVELFDDEDGNAVAIAMWIPKKYLKAWKELQDE